MKGRAPKTGYSRDQYGTGWTRVGGCDTRDRILRRDLTSVTVQTGTNGCKVLSGRLHDPYTGRTITMTYGIGDLVQIDHVVSLSDAWQKGAQHWTRTKRVRFANDPLNLLAVDGPTNESKSDGDTATWLPANKSYRCAFVARQVTVKTRYGLWVATAEKNAITRVLDTCPHQRTTTAVVVRTVKDRTPSYRTSGTTTHPKPAPPTTPTKKSNGTDPRYPTCAAAIRAGYGPYRRGKDPEYDWYRDQDGDGVVCE